MKFNVNKCKIMHIGPKNNRYKYYMEGKELAVTEEEKDVGVLVHNSMKPARQCKRAAGMASGVLRQLTKTSTTGTRMFFSVSISSTLGRT